MRAGGKSDELCSEVGLGSALVWSLSCFQPRKMMERLGAREGFGLGAVQGGR
jgi:hypothetical protein